MISPDNPEFVPEWDVLRDGDGKPVTITWQQVEAIWHAIGVVERVRRSEGLPSLWSGLKGIDLQKSRLLGRMLVDGKPPTRTKPPHEWGGPAWHLLPGGDPFGDDA